MGFASIQIVFSVGVEQRARSLNLQNAELYHRFFQVRLLNGPIYQEYHHLPKRERDSAQWTENL
jgi:hypothetical protein